MSLLQRTALREFVFYFFFAVAVLAFILLMDRLFLLADLLVRKGVPVLTVAEISFFSLPFVISVSAPLAGLIAGVITCGRMAQDNEVAVVRAAGIPAWRLFMPMMVLGLMLVPVMVGFNGYVVPETQHRVRNLLTDIARKKPALRIQERVFMDDFPGYVVYIGAINQRHSTVRNVIIFERSRSKVPPRFVTASRGRLGYTADDQYLVLTLHDGEIHELLENGNYRRLLFREQTIHIPSEDALVRQGRDYRTDDEMRFNQLLEQIRVVNNDIQELRAQIATLRNGNPDDEVTRFRIDELRTRIRYRRSEALRSLTELQKRLSLAFACFFFLLFGAPLGLALRRGGIGTGFIVGLIFFAFYYVLLLAGENLAENGRLAPFLGMWLPNILLVFPVLELSSRTFWEFSFFSLMRRRKLL